MQRIVQILIAALLLICIGGIGVWLAKIISIKDILGIVFNIWLITMSLGSLIGVGGLVFNLDKLLEKNDDEITFSYFYPLFTGWLFLNIIIPYVYMYDIEPSIPLQKFHFVDSNIIQILDSNFGRIIHFSVYFLSLIPFMMLFAFLVAYLRDFKKKSKTSIEEKSQIPKIKNNNYELLTLVMVIFSFFYIATNITYPTLVFLLNK
jgi:hypothetical protein